MRDYDLMRRILLVARDAGGDVKLTDLAGFGTCDEVASEVRRLAGEGLLEAAVETLPSGGILCGSVDRVTKAGEDFARLIESAEVWRIVSMTLERAGIDLSYPFLRDVCETVVKRYVERCIPDEAFDRIR